MGRSPCCCHEAGVKKGPWTEEEDRALVEHIQRHGGHVGSWRHLPKAAGLNRCGKSCRLRWTNYLRPDIKRGNFTDDEERLILRLHADLGNKWSTIATYLEGRTDNEIKNYWNTHIRKKLLRMGIDPATHQRLPPDDAFLLGGAMAAASPAAGGLSLLPDTLLSAAASFGGLNSVLVQAQALQALQLLLQASGGSSNGLMANLNNLAAANAMLNATGVAPSFQDQMNAAFSQANYRPSGYPGGDTTASFSEKDMAQQLNTAAPPLLCSSSAEPTDQYRDIAAMVCQAYPPEVVTTTTPAAAAVQGFGGLLEPMAMPDLRSLEDPPSKAYSLENDPFWKEMLESSFLQ
ncbi:hypothetical protein ACP4OV_031295 [Aristida adscensionis]